MIMMTPQTRAHRSMPALASVLLLLGTVACGSGTPAPDTTMALSPAGPVTIDIVRVVTQPLDVQLSLPGELTPYQSVAIHPRVSGFVKTVAVDRGSRVRAGDVLVTLEAPELVAQRSEAQSKIQAAEAQLAGAQAKADADHGTYDKLKAASATPGVVAGNDVLVAEKAAEASRNQVDAGRQQVEAGGKRRTPFARWKGTFASRRRSAASSPNATCIRGRSSGLGPVRLAPQCSAWSRTAGCGWWCQCRRPTRPR